MKLIEFSTRRRVTVTMFVVAALIFGMVAFQRLSINLLPDITYPTVTVRTLYEGAAPSEVERLITERRTYKRVWFDGSEADYAYVRHAMVVAL